MTIDRAFFPPRAESVDSFSHQCCPSDRPDEKPPGEAPKPDDELGMAWWNNLCEQARRRWMRIAADTGRAVDAWDAFKRVAQQDERSWRAGYAAAYVAKMAGKPTPRAPHGADGLSYASGAVEGAAAAGRELDPRDVIAEILEEHLIPDPRAVADAIVQHLRDSGFEITPINHGS